MRGDVSLENNGGFVQIALDLARDGGAVDACHWRGSRSTSSATTGATTCTCAPPTSSGRGNPTGPSSWRRQSGTIRLPFATFEPHRIDAPLDLARLRGLGIVAIGRFG
jgi:hypothetical protein